MPSEFLEKVKNSALFKSFIQKIDSRSNFRIAGHAGSFDSIIVFLAAVEVLDVKQNLLVITENQDQYNRLLDDLISLRDFHWPGIEIFGYSEDENLPFESMETEEAILTERQICIESLIQRQKSIIVTTIRALSKKIPKPEQLTEYKIELKIGENFKFSDLSQLLRELGFEQEDVVERAGSFAIRGGIIDIYPYGLKNPVRIEFFADEIETMRSFDIISQRSVENLKECSIYPGNRGISIHEGLFLDYISKEALIVCTDYDGSKLNLQTYFDEINSHLAKLKEKSDWEIEDHLLAVDALFNRLTAFHLLNLGRSSSSFPEEFAFETHPIESFNGHINLFREKLDSIKSTHKIQILCNNQGQSDRLNELLENDESQGLQNGIDFWTFVGELHEGFYYFDLAVYTDHQIFGRTKRTKYHRKFKTAQAIKHLQSLKPGDYVVHVDHGIARYAGLEKVKTGEHTEECLKLMYQNGDKVFVPLEHFSRVQKFSSEEGAEPKLNKLGSIDWERAKSRTKKSIRDIAQDLIKLYAERKSKKGFAFTPDSHYQYELEASFEFEDTVDQAKVTAEVKLDMESENPMDRLVCGDVGYGKTEIAIRAAFKAVQDNKQVAVLVPTTILADQHFENFTSRLKEFPVVVDVISRFRSPKEQKETIEKLKNKKVDIIIGTHRLLSKDIEFSELGLLVVDEEQRFGVTHKEKLRQLKSTVDTLTLTATPIPRTLHFSLMGGRDLSIINTPPHDRLAIKTEIIQYDEETIYNAVMREIDRGGQVYYVHNRVQSIDQYSGMLKMFLPKVRFGIIHGQMNANEVENIIHAFHKKEYDVLMATTIIENGIDIPNVNTIIIDQAQNFGLSQLYQLRGRVGRSSRQAYCYLLTPTFSIMPTEAQKRLQAIEEFTNLGSGFLIAMRDLEIRGAGNLLGAEQSGYVNTIGFELYCQILEEAVQEVRTEMNIESPVKTKAQKPTTTVHVYCDTFITEEYVNITQERVRIYKQLSEVTTLEEILQMENELEDRFGKLPPELVNLLKSLEIKIVGSQFGFDRITLEQDRYLLRWDQEFIKSPNNAELINAVLQYYLKDVKNVVINQTLTALEMKVGMPWFDVTKNRPIESDIVMSDLASIGFVIKQLMAMQKPMSSTLS